VPHFHSSTGCIHYFVTIVLCDLKMILIHYQYINKYRHKIVQIVGIYTK